MALPTKQYGLILPQKKGVLKNATVQRPSVFGDDSDDETSVGESLQREAIKKKMMKQTRIEMQKALEQDSTVYDYDAVYDDIQKERLESNKKILGGADKRPKYIHQLMRAVEDRKKEQERREERKIQKEREAEGEKFADKEAYVTTAYKQKLQELKEEQEREMREAAMEAALDVKKQQDLSGFYRHLLNQTVGEEAVPDRSAIQTPKVSEDVDQTSPAPSPTSRDNVPSSASDNEQEQKTGFSRPAGVSGHSKRQYRQRSPSSESGEEKERQRERDKHKKSHRDRGRDRDRERERDRDKNRGREREDRHAEKRSDRDRRKDRDRGRDERGDRDRTREDRHGKRERSPKEREREKNGDREKRRSSDEDKRKERNPDKEKKGATMEQKEGEKTETPEKNSKEKEREDSEENASKFCKRSTDQTVTSARERYLARQMARSASKSYVEKEED